MHNREKLEEVFVDNGFDDFKWIDAENIVVSNWVRMKCMFGCPEYGKRAACPPNVPSVEDCKKLMHEYRNAAIFHFQKAFPNPDDRHKWTKDINRDLLKLEKEVFLSGYVKAFLFLPESCQLCQECSSTRNECKYPKKSRPTSEAMAIDVFKTVKRVDFPIKVLRSPSDEMNRYAILLIE